VVVEVLSPGDDTWAKFGFYAAHGVREIITADPDSQEIRIHALDADRRGYSRTEASAVLGVTAENLIAEIAWP
jgi:Uma2 family endonuclease